MDNTNKNKDERIRRRTVVKSLGAVSGIGIGTQPVAAWGETELSQEDLELAQELLDSVEEVDPPFDARLLGRGRNTDGFRTLISAIEADYEKVQIAGGNVYRADKLGIYVVQFYVTVPEPDHDGEIIVPIDNPRLSPGEHYSDVNLEPGAVINAYSDDAPIEINQYRIEEQTDFSTSGYAGVSKHYPIDDVNRVTIDLTTAENEIQIHSDATCEQCKLAVGAINASSCGLGTYFVCAGITAKTIVGPVACAAVVPTICFIIQNYGTNNPERTCAGEDPMGNKVLPDELDTFC